MADGFNISWIHTVQGLEWGCFSRVALLMASFPRDANAESSPRSRCYKLFSEDFPLSLSLLFSSLHLLT